MSAKAPKPIDQVGARRTSHGGVPQKWVLSEQGRRMMVERYDGVALRKLSPAAR
jgi:hypothetical protein